MCAPAATPRARSALANRLERSSNSWNVVVSPDAPMMIAGKSGELRACQVGVIGRVSTCGSIGVPIVVGPPQELAVSQS